MVYATAARDFIFLLFFLYGFSEKKDRSEKKKHQLRRRRVGCRPRKTAAS
jgi:hypothetical protein